MISINKHIKLLLNSTSNPPPTTTHTHRPLLEGHDVENPGELQQK